MNQNRWITKTYKYPDGREFKMTFDGEHAMRQFEERSKIPMQIQMGNQQFQKIFHQMFRSFGGEEMKFIKSHDFRSKCLEQFSNSEAFNIEWRGMLKLLKDYREIIERDSKQANNSKANTSLDSEPLPSTSKASKNQSPNSNASQDQHKSQNLSPKKEEPVPYVVSTFYVFIKNFVPKLYESSDKSNEFAWLDFYDKTWQKFMDGVYDVKDYFDLADAFKLSLHNWKATFFFGTKCIATAIRELMQREWDGEHNCTRQISQATIISYKMLGFLNVPKNYEEFVVPPFKSRNDPPTPLEMYDFMDWHRQRFPVVERLRNMQIFIDDAIKRHIEEETMQKLITWIRSSSLDVPSTSAGLEAEPTNIGEAENANSTNKLEQEKISPYKLKNRVYCNRYRQKKKKHQMEKRLRLDWLTNKNEELKKILDSLENDCIKLKHRVL